MGRGFVARNDRDSFERPSHLNTSFFPTTNLREVVAKGLTAGPEFIVETFPQGKRKGGHGRGGFLKEDFSQSKLIFHESCCVEETTDTFCWNRRPAPDFFCESCLLDQASQQESEVGCLEILPPVLEVVDEYEGDVMMIECSGETVQFFGSFRKKSEGHGEGFQNGGFTPCHCTKTSHWIGSDPMRMKKLFLADVFPRFKITVVEVAPKGMIQREDRVKSFDTLHMFKMSYEQQGYLNRELLIQNPVV
jgi:hypothetical protein